jgi:hypothetical protein
MDITAGTTKSDIVNFTNRLKINTNEIDKNYNAPVYVDPTTTDIILITVSGKVWGRYNHIYKNGNIKIEVDGKWENFSKVKNKIKSIIFLDDINKHETLRKLWSENGFKWNREEISNTKEMIYNSL